MAKKKTSKAKESMNSVDILEASLSKKHGKGFIVSDNIDSGVEWVSTGILSLDRILGKGFPRGRIIEVYGPESSGKTSLTLHAIAKYQKKGYKAAFIDAEYAWDANWSKSFGVNTDDIMLIQPDCGEDALDAAETMVKSNLLDIIVVDSVAALVPKAEVEGEMGASHMGLQARLMSQALRKLTAIIGKTKTTVIFINQLRMKIGVVFGNPETTSGGNALKFYSSVRVDVRRKSVLGEKDNPKGIAQKIKVIKNKCSPPFRETELNLYYGKGYDVVGDLVDLAVNFGVVEKEGSWYNYQGERLGQGEAKAVKALKSNKDFLKSIFKEVRSILNSGGCDE